MDTRWFRPEPGLTAASAARRPTCQVPAARTVHTQPQVAVASVRALPQEALLAFTCMVAAGLAGHSPAWMEAAAPCGGTIAGVSMPAEPGWWVQAPVTQPKR